MKYPLSDEWIIDAMNWRDQVVVFGYPDGLPARIRDLATAAYRKALEDAEKAVSTLIIYPAGEAAKPHFVRVIRAITPDAEAPK